MRFLGRSLMGLVLLSLTVGLLAWAGASVFSAIEARRANPGHERPARERVFAVNVMRATPGRITPVLGTYGEVRSTRQLDLRASASGRIKMLADGFEDGGAVEKGALLVRIDPADAQSALAQAQTGLAQARNEVSDAESALVLAGDDLKLALAQAELRARALARQKGLQKRGVGTEATVEATALANAAAQQVVLSRRQAIQRAQAQFDQAKIGLERQKLAVEDARRRLADTEIHAPFTGVLDQVSVVAGGIVGKNERLARLIDPTALEVVFRVSTSQYARLLDKKGRLRPLPVSATLDVLGVDLEAHGRLSREGAAVGKDETGRQLFAGLDAAPGFRPGDFVNVAVREPPLDNVVLLPSAAVSADRKVLVLGRDSRLEELRVTLLRRQGNDVIVRAPDLAGREVVRERSPLLGAGIKVRPLRQKVGEGDARSNAGAAAEAPETLALDPARRARLVAYVKGNTGMPAEARARVLAQLAQPRVPARVVARIEARIGG